MKWFKKLFGLKEKQFSIEHYPITNRYYPKYVRCSYFYPDKTTSSATKCICGREKWEHHQSVYLSSETGKNRRTGQIYD